MILALLSIPVFAAEDIRESYDPAGNLSHRLVLVDGTLVEESGFQYAAGNLVEKTTVKSGSTTIERWTYVGGVLTVHEVTVDGVLQSKESSTYAGGRLQSRVTQAAGQPDRTTTWSYDLLGRPILVETRSADGSLLSRVESSRSRPIVPVHFELSLGGNWSSQTEVLDLASGFEVSRTPDSAIYDVDPLEFKVGMAYKLSRSEGETVNDDLTAWFAMDYNHLVPRTTLFFFSTLARNPIANLNADLILAPIGLKYEIVENQKFLLDLSFAPLWNYRSIVAPAGGSCDGVLVTSDTLCETSRLRGSFRLRLGYTGKSWSIQDTTSYIPAIDPVDFAGGFGDGSILTNSLGLSVKLSSHLSLNQSVLLTRDLSLAAQVDCAAEPENLLCKGLMYTSTTALAFSFDLAK